MIDLKKQDNVADAVNEILQQEALKGNQGAIDANHNAEVDAQDFKILRAKKKKVEEEIDMADRTKDTLVGREKTKQKDDVGPNSNAKVSKFKLKSEESEQIDELSINTLTRVKHAATSAASDASREGDEGKSTKRYDLAGKASNKIETKNRSLGLKPSGQHAFEEVEQIDELSKSTLGSYLDKKKSEYMKGKTQSGSKENAKDIQNMGKAHDKMKKEEYTLKQMKERLEEPVLDELINEVLSKDADAGDYIHDFIHSDNPKFAGKSDAKRKEMALGAYYSKKNEEVESIDEGWDDMVKDAKEKVKSGPKPSGGSGVKQGTRYGGSKQKEKPEQDVKEATDTVEKDPKTGKVKSWMHTGDWKKDNGKAGRGKVTNMSDKARRRTEKMSEGKDPNMDAGVGSQPNFATDMTKPMKVAQTLAKKSLGRMRNEMMGKKNV